MVSANTPLDKRLAKYQPFRLYEFFSYLPAHPGQDVHCRNLHPSGVIVVGHTKEEADVAESGLMTGEMKHQRNLGHVG